MLSNQISLLTKLEPIAALSSGRLQELASMCMVETVSQGLNPFRMNVVQNEQLLYLLKGDLRVVFQDGQDILVQGDSDESRHPVAPNRAAIAEARALTDIQILRIDADLLDIMLTWDQLASYEKSGHAADGQARSAGQWMESTGVFSAESLKNGIFRALPLENVEKMFQRMWRIPVETGQTVIRQGDEGDYYYLIEQGIAQVTRILQSGGPAEVLAELGAGTAFGEEALASGNKRNATVVMKSDGILLRLGKADFAELLKTPLLHQVSREDAKRLVQTGAQLLDVRTSGEFDLKHHTGAINIPLQNIREAMITLNKNTQYLMYCQSGRRAAAATFILAQHGFKAIALSA